jgi:hypothetical protein
LFVDLIWGRLNEQKMIGGETCATGSLCFEYAEKRSFDTVVHFVRLYEERTYITATSSPSLPPDRIATCIYLLFLFA